jgi:BirA family biotin operon repressor/biotin-[acetyl-CoA-carboxylase] ligase
VPAAPGELAWQVVALHETSSTSDVCRELADAGFAEGTVVIADVQTRGRGRLGRSWVSPAGAGLWCSALLRPDRPLAHMSPLALVLAVAARRAVAADVPNGAEVEIKWPNDLMWRGRKLAGILTEAKAGADPAGAPDHIIAGIGINLETPPGGFAPQLLGTAVSLAEIAGARPDAGAIGARLLREVGRAYRELVVSGFGGLRAEWLRHNCTVGRAVTATAATGAAIAGWAEDIDGSGQLIIRLGDGARSRVAAGDVTLRVG